MHCIAAEILRPRCSFPTGRARVGVRFKVMWRKNMPTTFYADRHLTGFFGYKLPVSRAGTSVCRSSQRDAIARLETIVIYCHGYKSATVVMGGPGNFAVYSQGRRYFGTFTNHENHFWRTVWILASLRSITWRATILKRAMFRRNDSTLQTLIQNRAARRVVVALLATLLSALSSGCAWLDAKQRQMIFNPTAEIAGTPEDFNLQYEEVWVPVTAKTTAGHAIEHLHGWWIPAGSPHAPAMLFLHGNGWNIGDSAYNTARLQRMGFSILAIDYRGFGRSEGGFPSESQVYEDAEAAWSYLKTREPDVRKRYIYGHSLGGAVAIDLAVKSPDAAGLIVESSFTSMPDMGRRGAWLQHLPLDWLITQRFDSLAKIGKLTVPVLFIHGTADDIIPMEMSKRLYAAAPQPKRLVLIPDAGHSSIAVVGLAQYRRAVQEFVRLAGTRPHESGVN